MTKESTSKKPKLEAERIEKFRQEKRWPPPDGITVFPRERPSMLAVAQEFVRLERVATPEQRKIIDRAKDKVTKKK